jgi:outer membrane protein TolC
MRRAILLTLAAAFTAAAQLDRVEDALKKFERNGELRLTLSDALAIALENNLDIEIQRQNPGVAEQDLLRARAGQLLRGLSLTTREGPRSASSVDAALTAAGVFSPDSSLSISTASPVSTGKAPPSLDPQMIGSLRWGHLTAPQPNSFIAGTSSLISDNTQGALSLQQGFLSGGDLVLSFDNLRQSVNQRRYDLNPLVSSSLGLTFTQPLLRGFGVELNSRFIRIAKNNRKASGLMFEQQVINTSAAVIRLYWDLVGYREETVVKRQALERSEKLLSDNREKEAAGTVASIEVVRARAEVARSRRDLLAAEALVRQQENILKDYLTKGRVSDPWLRQLRVLPIDSLDPNLGEQLPSTGELAGAALLNRPDLAQARVQIENSRIGLKASRNALLPSVDLVASARNNALAGDVNPLTLVGAPAHSPDALLVGGYGSALGQIVRRNFPDYSVGVQVIIPLRNRAAKADEDRDRIAVQQQELRLSQIEKQVHLEIENAMIALDQARAAVESARSEKQFQEAALAAEEDRLGVGASTTFIVIQYQRDLAQARSAEVAALASFVKARAAVDRAAGLLLVRHNIQMP